MLESRIIEIKDHATCIVAMATIVSKEPMQEREREMLSRIGWKGSGGVVLCYLQCGLLQINPHEWLDDTMHIAHMAIDEMVAQGRPVPDTIDVDAIRRQTVKSK